MDVVGSLLSTASVRGTVAATVLGGGRWGLRMPQASAAAFHAVTSGSAFLVTEEGGTIPLSAGDVVLLSDGVAHDLLSTPDVAPIPFDRSATERALDTSSELVVGDADPTTRVICASYDYDRSARLSPFHALPSVLYLPALGTSAGLRSSLALMSEELVAPSFGVRLVLDHAVNIVLIQLLRSWVTTRGHASARPSWLRALSDPTTHAALAALHRDPRYPWTTSLLARSVGVSRATLTRRFTAEAGTTPGEYLATWRMEVAAQRLRTGEETIAAIAHGVGYQSEYAFSRAFTRHHGIAPGRYRSRHRA